MNPPYTRWIVPAVRRLLACVALLALGLVAPALLPAQTPAGGGSITGTVFNAGTRALLQGALVEISALGRQTFSDKRTIVNLGVAYQFTPKLNVNLDVTNLLNEPVSLYRGIPDQVERWIYTGTTLNLGVSGRF